jgi:feruloyl esterase
LSCAYAQQQAPQVPCARLFALSGFEFTVESATQEAPEYCRVVGLVQPEIRFEAVLPAQWNGRFLMTGNGGYAGDNLDAPQRVAQRAAAARRGFATASSNTGHDARREPLASFAGDRQKLLDYAFRSLHVTAEAGKRVTAAYYGVKPSRAYYQGCSTGGRQGLILAQRFPDDFDGIVAGAPVLNFSGTMASYACSIQALAAAPIPHNKVSLLSERISAMCDEKDGLKDGLIDDPRRCGFQPARDLPKCEAGADNATCFTAAQIGTLEKIYADVNVAGKRYFPGWPVGAEMGWDPWTVRESGEKTTSHAFSESFFRHMAFPSKEQGMDLREFNADKDVPRLEWIHNILDATNPDLTAFRARNGKLLMYFGWADPALNAQMGVDYYESALKTMGPQTPEFFRLFMLPGVFHCRGGVGPDAFDPLAVVMDWVENGKAPDRIVATRAVNGKPVRTRPLCPYPQTAKYKGSGSIDDAENFRCY